MKFHDDGVSVGSHVAYDWRVLRGGTCWRDLVAVVEAEEASWESYWWAWGRRYDE